MSDHVKKFRAALKHGAFSATAILPGEDPVAFKKTHEDIIAELAPDGALEDHIVWTIARLVWRKKNFATLRKGELALEHQSRIQAQIRLDEVLEMREAAMQAADDQARKDLGANYELVEIGEVATVDRLLQDLAVEERVDAIVDKCLKRLLFLRGLKSLRPVSSSPPLPPAPATPVKNCVSISSRFDQSTEPAHRYFDKTARLRAAGGRRVRRRFCPAAIIARGALDCTSQL